MDVVAFGRYQLIELIGEGGMGKVYKAHDTVIDREVAIKVLPKELATQPGYRARFRREAHIVARLNEPHIIPVYDTGEIDDQLYLVMPVIDGIDLHSLLERDGPMTPRRAVEVIEQIAAALDTAHAHGLVHRDIKPSNALMTGKGFVYLIDFGIAHDSEATRLTRTDSVVGTFAYMAPERFREGTADARADVYALTCVFYECLTGQLPYPGDSLEQQIAGHVTMDPPRITTVSPGVPPGFDAVIAGGLAKSPEQRYQTASALATAARRAIGNGSEMEAIATDRPDSPESGPDQKTVAMTPPTEVLSPVRPVSLFRRVSRGAKTLATGLAPLMPFTLAAVLALAAVAVAFIGLGSPPQGGDLPPGTVTIAGADPTGSGVVSVDLSKPIPITVTAADANSVALSLDILGAQVGRHEAALAPDPAGRSATVPPPVNRYVLAGRTTAQITVLRDHNSLGTYRFTMSSTQSGATTVAAAVTVVLALLAGAYIESNLRVLRRGRGGVATVFAVPLFAAVLAVAAVAAGWVFLGHPLTVATLAWSAGLAAAAGIAAVIGSNRVGRRARSRRVQRAQTQLVATRLALQRHPE